MIKKEYISPVISIEVLEDEELMIGASYTTTTNYGEDPSEDDNDYIHIHPDPIDPPSPIDDDGDY
jgi:hypothetical protein